MFFFFFQAKSGKPKSLKLPEVQRCLFRSQEKCPTRKIKTRPVIYGDIPGEISTLRMEILQGSDDYFIANFNPKSTVITRNANLDVSSVRIENSVGKEVNCILPGEEYVISYKVNFFEKIEYINHGMGLKTELGVVVTWRFFPDCNSFSDRVYKNGDVLEVKWRFKCLLVPATYFIGITIKQKGEYGGEVIYRAADIDVFQVIGPKGFDRGGFFDTGFSVELT